MFVHKLNNRVAGVMLAIGVVVVVSAVVWKRHIAPYPLGIKSDRLDVSPQADCSDVAWPFGCDWRSYAAPERKKPSRFGQRRHARLRLIS